jgi:hypothetical protein
MAGLRRVVEHWLRATGTFRLTKRMIQRVETTGLQVLKYLKQLAHGGSRRVRTKQNLVMFHTGRSGSSVIADLLSQHPDIHWDGELFNYRLMLWRGRQKFRMREGIGLIKRRMNLFDEPFYGFEVLPTHLHAGQMDEGDFIAALEDLGFEHFILLTRRNILRKIVSNLVARERGQWRLGAGETAPLTRVHVDTRNLTLASVKPLLSHIDDLLADYETLSSLLNSRHCLQIVYEDDVHRDPRCAYRKICEFLGVAYLDIPVRHGQTTPHPLRQIIQNYDEVASVLSATEFAWMLEERSDIVVCPECTP